MARSRRPDPTVQECYNRLDHYCNDPPSLDHHTRKTAMTQFTCDRRQLLIAAIAGSTFANATGTKDSLHAARLRSRHRRRRVIFNNDGDDIWTKGADTVERFLDVRHRPLLGTQVDSVFYCTTQSFNKFTHATKVAERFLATSGSFADNHLAAFASQGTDGLRMSAEFCRANNMESFWTLRMNDIHDAWTNEFLSDWKQQDPSRIMAARDDVLQFNDRRRLWSLVDFEHPDVQPRLLAIIQEVLQDYPVDGIELDWLRAPFYFRSHYEGKEVTDRQVAVLSQLMTSIRKLVDAESVRQNRPLLLASRVPVTSALCRRIGIDIEGWLRHGLLDILSISGGYVTVASPVAELITLGHQHGVPVYPCLSQSGLLYRAPRGKGETQEPASWFAAAQNGFAQGADGMYAFNLFPGPYVYPNFTGPNAEDAQIQYVRDILSSIGTRRSLQAADKLYAISDAGNYMPMHYLAKDAEEFSVALPQELTANHENTLPPLIVPERRAELRKYGSARIRIDLRRGQSQSVPLVSLNGRLLRIDRTEQIGSITRISTLLPAASIQAGANELTLKPREDDQAAVGADVWLKQ